MKKIIDFFASSCAPWLFAAVLALIVSFVAVWYGSLNQDEGWYLYAAQMVRAGKFPYRDFFYTQGPAMPFVYSVLSPVWGMASPLHGLLGGRVVTLALGFLATSCAVGLVRRLVPDDRRTLAGFSVFALLACNIYHLYFTTIPKTYSLGSLFLMAGLLMISRGMEAFETCGRTLPRTGRFFGASLLFVGGMSLAFATGTRISLLLILPVAGFTLLFCFRTYRWAFLWYGLGGVLGLFLTYGIFAIDPESLEGLLAAQGYHAARGGFDPFFAIGSVSRLSRGYAALGVVLFAWLKLIKNCELRIKNEETVHDRKTADQSPIANHQSPTTNHQSPTTNHQSPTTNHQSPILWILGLGFGAVFCLQLSAPFPYDDYQVPVMGMLTVLIVAVFARRVERPVRAMWFVILTAGLISFTSPALQEWSTYAQDRFWSQKKEMTELAKLRQMGKALNYLDPGGTTLLTQDLYLAIETGRTVPSGLEMGPFSYFPDLDTEKAKSVHVLNRELMTELLESAPCSVAACSAYAFAIAAPKCTEVPFDEQRNFFQILRKHYELKDTEPNFGQNATRLLLLTRKSIKNEELRIKNDGDYPIIKNEELRIKNVNNKPINQSQGTAK